MNKFILYYLLIFSCINMYSHPGIGLVMDSKGNIFYTDLVHVWKITPDGNCTIAVKNIHTHELYIDAKDNLYGEHEWYKEAEDKWGNYTWRLTKDNVFEKTLESDNGFLKNNTLVRDLDGNTFWSQKNENHQILYKETIDGDLCLLTDHKFKDIRWLYFSKYDNHLYLVDELQIKKVSPIGKVEIVAENLKEKSNPFQGVADRHYIFGMWSDLNKNLYVSIFGANKVIKISAIGEQTTLYKSNAIWSPCGGLTSFDGSIYILEYSKFNKARVVKINTDGTRIIFEC